MARALSAGQCVAIGLPPFPPAASRSRPSPYNCGPVLRAMYAGNLIANVAWFAASDLQNSRLLADARKRVPSSVHLKILLVNFSLAYLELQPASADVD